MMPRPEEHPGHATGRPLGVVPIHVTCPHCGHPLDIVPVPATAPAGEAEPHETPTSPAGRIGRAALRALERRLFPFGATVESSGEQDGRDAGSFAAVQPRSWGMLLLVVLGIALVAALLIWLGQPAGSPLGSSPPLVTPATQPALPATNVGNLSADEAAILDTLTRYNSAESEAAALLTIEPLLPFIDPTSPFAQTRAAYLAQRRQQNAPHRTILVRWAIGEISINGTTATVITQETWSNQEVGAVAADQATVRVTYTLRRDSPTGRWLIVKSEQMEL